MQTNTIEKKFSVEHLLSLVLGYPLLVAYLGLAIADTLQQNMWAWILGLILVYLGVLIGVRNLLPRRQRASTQTPEGAS